MTDNNLSKKYQNNKRRKELSKSADQKIKAERNRRASLHNNYWSVYFSVPIRSIWAAIILLFGYPALMSLFGKTPISNTERNILFVIFGFLIFLSRYLSIQREEFLSRGIMFRGRIAVFWGRIIAAAGIIICIVSVLSLFFNW